MDMFENKAINGWLYATRFIASWTNEGGRLETGEDKRNFRKWLKSLTGISDKDVNHIFFLATNGRLELETSARRFLNDMQKESE